MNTSLRKALLLAGLGSSGLVLPSARAWSADPAPKTAEADTSKATTPAAAKHRARHDDARADADNTGTNKRDRDPKEVTADQQKNNKSDVQLTAEIRRAIMKDKTLSTSAHNIKIIVQDGNVTLKGPVASKDEKASVEHKATEVIGANNGKLTSEVAVAP